MNVRIVGVFYFLFFLTMILATSTHQISISFHISWDVEYNKI